MSVTNYKSTPRNIPEERRCSVYVFKDSQVLEEIAEEHISWPRRCEKLKTLVEVKFVACPVGDV